MMKNNNTDDTALLAARKFVKTMTRKSNFVLHFGSLREAFLAGVSYEKNKKEEVYPNDEDSQDHIC